MYNDSFKSRYGIAPLAISENDSHYDTMAHIHSEIELLCLDGGEADVTVCDRRYRLSEGEILIVNPLDVHSIRAERSGPYHQRCICFDLSLIADAALASRLLSGECRITELFTKGMPETALIKKCFDSLFSAVKRNTSALLFESYREVSGIFAALICCEQIERKKLIGKKQSFPGKIQEYLSANYREEITSEDAAKEFFYTQSYFCRLFRESFGVSFLEYLSMYRISRAKSELSGGDKRICEVAESVGFTDSSYFSRCFKRLVGVSPSEYKKHQYSY